MHPRPPAHTTIVRSPQATALLGREAVVADGCRCHDGSERLPAKVVPRSRNQGPKTLVPSARAHNDFILPLGDSLKVLGTDIWSGCQY
jgi:hypothetical protein